LITYLPFSEDCMDFLDKIADFLPGIDLKKTQENKLEKILLDFMEKTQDINEVVEKQRKEVAHLIISSIEIMIFR